MTLQTVLDDIRKRPGTGDVIPIIDPVTEEQITEFTDCGEEGVNEAVVRAKESFEAGVWSGLAGTERAKILWRIADLIDEHAAEFAEIDSANTGMMKMHVGAGGTHLRGVLPVLRRVVHQGQRHRVQRAVHRYRLGRLRRPARLHAQGALRCRRADLPVERAHLQRLRQDRPRPRGGLQQPGETR